MCGRDAAQERTGERGCSHPDRQSSERDLGCWEGSNEDSSGHRFGNPALISRALSSLRVLSLGNISLGGSKYSGVAFHRAFPCNPFRPNN